MPSITKGQGYWRGGYDEIFNIGKNWLLWNWRDNEGRYFNGKRDAMRFIKICANK